MSAIPAGDLGSLIEGMDEALSRMECPRELAAEDVELRDSWLEAREASLARYAELFHRLARSWDAASEEERGRFATRRGEVLRHAGEVAEEGDRLAEEWKERLRGVRQEGIQVHRARVALSAYGGRSVRRG